MQQMYSFVCSLGKSMDFGCCRSCSWRLVLPEGPLALSAPGPAGAVPTAWQPSALPAARPGLSPAALQAHMAGQPPTVLSALIVGAWTTGAYIEASDPQVGSILLHIVQVSTFFRLIGNTKDHTNHDNIASKSVSCNSSSRAR